MIGYNVFITGMLKWCQLTHSKLISSWSEGHQATKDQTSGTYGTPLETKVDSLKSIYCNNKCQHSEFHEINIVFFLVEKAQVAQRKQQQMSSIVNFNPNMFGV